MKIIIQGREVDTLDIWDIELNTESRFVNVIIKIKDAPQILIGRSIPYETYPTEFREIYAPYERIYKEIKEKWEADKADIPIFKL